MLALYAQTNLSITMCDKVRTSKSSVGLFYNMETLVGFLPFRSGEVCFQLCSDDVACAANLSTQIWDFGPSRGFLIVRLLLQAEVRVTLQSSTQGVFVGGLPLAAWAVR